MSQVVQIADRAEHDAIVEQSKQKPTVIYVSNSSLPTCRAYTPQYEELAEREQQSGVRFAQMDFNTNTSMLFKFSPNQLPVTVLMVRDRWCRTVMGPNMPELEATLSLLIEEAKRGGEL